MLLALLFVWKKLRKYSTLLKVISLSGGIPGKKRSAMMRTRAGK